MAVDYQKILREEFAGADEALRIVTEHSQAVADMALEIAAGLEGVDKDFLREAAMLHDIGIIACDAPSLGCHGTDPYIRHGVLGAEMLRRRGLERHARVCERHTGAGLSRRDIESQNLPLPPRDFLPETLEEKIICYADKFYSKSGELSRRKPLEKVRAQMAAHGPQTLARFDEMHNLLVKKL